MKYCEVLIPLFLALASCQNNAQPAKQIALEEHFPKRVVVDTISPGLHHIIEEHLDSTHYLLGVETSNGLVFMPDTNHLYQPHNWGQYFYSPDFVVFLQGNGSDTHTSMVVDLNKGTSKEYYMEFKYSLKDSLVCYWPYPWPTDKVAIENFVTGKKDSIQFEEDCISALIHYCFDIDSLSRNYLYYQWDPKANGQNSVLSRKFNLR